MKLKKNNFKLQVTYLFSAVALLSYISVKNEPIKETVTVMAPMKGVDLLIVQEDEQHLLIPLTLTVDEVDSVENKLMKMVELMSTPLPLNGITPILPQGCELLDVELVGENAELNLNNHCFNYDKNNELKVIEGLVWASTSLDEISTLTFAKEGAFLEVTPHLQLPITQPIDRMVGINNFEWGSNTLHDTQQLNIYYVKSIDGKDYYLPKSKRVNSSLMSIEGVVKTIVDDISVSSKLVQPLAVEGVSVEEVVWGEDGVLNIHLDSSILNEENTCKKVAFDILMLSVKETLDFNQVRLYVDGVIVNEHGLNEDTIDLKQLKVNPILL